MVEQGRGVEGLHLSYAVVEREARRVAGSLRRRGVRVGTGVGVCQERGVGSLMRMLGISQAGGSVVPLDGRVPEGRLQGILQAAGVALVLSDAPTLSARVQTVAASGVPWVEVGVLQREGVGREEDGRRWLWEGQEAYVIYTSGSTGVPKGVMVSQRGVSQLARSQGERFGVGSESRVLQYAALTFDAAVAGCWEHMGGRGHAGGAAAGGDPGGWAAAGGAGGLGDQHRDVAALGGGGSLRREGLEGVETLIVAGEACPVGVQWEWGVGRRFCNAYGPTEATVCGSVRVYAGGRAGAEGRGRGGEPGVGRGSREQLHVLDGGGQPVRVGVIGEMYLGEWEWRWGMWERQGRRRSGLCHIRGRRGEAGARLYRTGDQGRYREDGTVEYVGRGTGR